MKRFIIFFTLSMSAFSLLWADEDGDDQELQAMVRQLQSEVQSLRAEVQMLKAQRPAEPPKQVTSSSLTSSADKAGGGAFALPKIKPERFSLEVYGFLKADAFRDSETTSHQEIPYWSLSNKDGGEVDFTARETRLGLRVKELDAVAGGALSGVIETDFYGNLPAPGNVSGNHGYTLRTRHLYLQWAGEQWTFLAGKTWEAYILMFPEMLNFGYYNFQGQLGHRRMQFQARRDVALGEGRSLELTAALDEPMGGIHGGDADGDGVDDGTDSELPGMIARARYTFPGIAGRKSMVGISGLYAQEDVAGKTYEAYAAIAGGMFPLTESLQWKANLWFGQNLDSAWGGIAQGINLALRREIEAYGGWTQLRWQAGESYWFNAGYSIDNPDNADLSAGARSANQTYMINANYAFSKPFTVGLEYFQTDTDYKGGASSTNHRVQSSVKYQF